MHYVFEIWLQTSSGKKHRICYNAETEKEAIALFRRRAGCGPIIFDIRQFEVPVSRTQFKMLQALSKSPQVYAVLHPTLVALERRGLVTHSNVTGTSSLVTWTMTDAAHHYLANDERLPVSAA